MFSRRLSFIVFLLTTLPGAAFAACGASGCPIDVHGQRATEQGMVSLDWSYQYLEQDVILAGRKRVPVGAIRGHHDEIGTRTQIQQISIDAGLTDRLGLVMSVPFIRRQHEHIHNHMGTPFRDTWDLNGPGDLTAVARYAVLRADDGSAQACLLAGGVAPTGKNRLTNDAGDEAEPGVQPSPNSWGLILGASGLRNVEVRTANGKAAPLSLFASSTYQWNRKGDDDYRIGNEWQTSVGAVYPVLPGVGLSLQANARVRRRDDRGNTREEVQKTGGSFVFLTPGLRLRVMENVSAYVHLQLPVYQRVNVIQPATDYNLIVGVTSRFSVL